MTLAIVVIALAAAGWATHAALRSFLIDRVDHDLATSQLPSVTRGPGLFDGADRRFAPGFPVGAVVQVRSASGAVLRTAVARDLSGDETPAPTLPEDLDEGFSTVDPPESGEYRVLVARAGSPEARVPSDALPFGGLIAVAVPLEDVNDTLTRLLLIQLAVGAATLAGLALLALWLVRLGLRPLDEIGATADAIAAGDLSRRVEDASPRTEIGRLGGTLNAMLSRIEELFAERRRAEERLRRFVADASHELQTPLTSVRGYAELFRRGAAQRPEDLETAMRRIEAEATRMGVLVDDLLLLAGLEQGRPMARGRVDLAAVATELAADARVVEPDRPITVVAGSPVVVDGDDARLRQVVGNLLANARAHTPSGTPVTVTARADGTEAVIEVADRGPGLSPGDAARVFERFFRADPSRARASGGSGLGLSIVAAIAGSHGGRAEVTSAPGEGSTFRVVLPLAEADPGGPGDPREPEEPFPQR